MATSYIWWLIAGAALCSMELFIPTAFVALMLGVSALLVALLSLVVSKLWLQVVLWMGISTLLILLSRRFLPPPRRASKIPEATEGETLTEIPAGQVGRVLYEGNSWRARCEDQSRAIAPHQKVYVVGRQDTTLLVLPEELLHD